ncbi:hypothetical protein Pmani_012966 [Petrolisthes manimaculis]|uniref:Spindle and kinetochore-associated protein 3 n=1 Tax=Petrolisthes manimaculis TaxID=1843537 RepID=A0AAE1PYC3_9EUCA|nr:hypothetical protein Pmani_012966 [Petrolisthes manimaculis]
MNSCISGASTMEQDLTTNGFFGQLKTLCCQIDKNVSSLTFNLNQPAGEKPYSYDTTLKALNKDVQEVKTAFKEIRKQLLPTSKFSDYIEAMEELLNTQKKDIDKMEHYLTKFSYTPLPKPVEKFSMMEAAQNEDQQKMEEDCDRNVADGVLRGTPVLTSQLSVNPSVQHISHQASASIKSEPQDTPVSSKMERVGVEINVVPPDAETHKLGVNLLSEENGNDAPTPVIMPSNNPLWRNIITVQEDDQLHQPVGHMYKQIGAGNQLQRPDGHMSNRIPLPITPEEPHLSEYTMQLLSSLRSAGSNHNNTYSTINVPHTIERGTTDISADPIESQLAYSEGEMCTPEEPTLYNPISKSQFEYTSPSEPVLSCEVRQLKDIFRDNKTPEEPALSCEVGLNKGNLRDKKVPEEPALFYEAGFNKKDQRDNKTPEEPVLFYGAGHRNGNYRENKTPEEPELLTMCRSRPVEHYASKLVETDRGYDNDLPFSPELSEVTRSVLSLSTRAHQPIHQGPSNTTHYNKPRQHRVGPSFSDVYSQLSAKPSPDQQQPREVLQPLNRNLRTNFSSGVEKSTLTVPTYSSSTTMENFLGIDAMPPSPQLSEVTQRIFGQWRK